jgi:hypothetical protein
MKIKRTPEERALRSAYTKARDIAHKRITRLMKKYGKEEVQTRLLHGKEDFAKLSNLHDDSDIAREYNRIQKFLSSENSRLPSYNKPIYDAKKQAALDKFHEYGYDFVTMDNLDTVISYLEELKDRKDAEEYDSTQIIDIAVQAFEYKISPTKMKSGFIDYEKTQTKIEKRLNKLEKQGKDTALSSQNFRDRWL